MIELLNDHIPCVYQIYEQMPNEKGTTVYTLQKKFQNMFGFTLPLFHGRGLLNYNLGLLPYRRRIVAVSKYIARHAWHPR